MACIILRQIQYNKNIIIEYICFIIIIIIYNSICYYFFKGLTIYGYANQLDPYQYRNKKV